MTITQFTDAGSQRCAPVRARLRLFCFSYAGGSAAVFRNWPHFLPAAVEVQPIELPGHGRRIKEAPIDNITALVEELASTIPLRALPFAFFGHSMGALVSFELTRLLRRQRHPLPECLFVSAYRVPHLPARRSQARAALSDSRLWRAARPHREPAGAACLARTDTGKLCSSYAARRPFLSQQHTAAVPRGASSRPG